MLYKHDCTACSSSADHLQPHRGSWMSSWMSGWGKARCKVKLVQLFYSPPPHLQCQKGKVMFPRHQPPPTTAARRHPAWQRESGPPRGARTLSTPSVLAADPPAASAAVAEEAAGAQWYLPPCSRTMWRSSVERTRALVLSLCRLFPGLTPAPPLVSDAA